MSDLLYDWISPSDVFDALRIEQEGWHLIVVVNAILTCSTGYPPDEAASLEAFQYAPLSMGDLVFLPTIDIVKPKPAISS